MNIFIKNKKILALALCLSITAGQANAISLSSVCKSALSFLNPIKQPTGDTQNFVLTQLAICAAISIVPILKAIQNNTHAKINKKNNDDYSRNKYKILKNIKKTIRNSAIYATAIATLNVPGLYKLLPAIVCAGGFLIYNKKKQIGTWLKNTKDSINGWKTDPYKWRENYSISRKEQADEKEKLELNKKLIKLVEKNIEKDGTVTVETLISQGADANATVSPDEKEETDSGAEVCYSQSEGRVLNIKHKSNFRLLVKALLAEKQNSELIVALINNGNAKLRYQDLLLLLAKSKNKKVNFDIVSNTKVTEFICIKSDGEKTLLNSLTVKDVLAFEGLETKEEKAKFITDKEQAENEAIKESSQEMLKKSFKSPSQLKSK